MNKLASAISRSPALGSRISGSPPAGESARDVGRFHTPT